MAFVTRKKKKSQRGAIRGGRTMLYTPRARGEPLVAAGHFQRCPKPEENQVPVLRGARHVQEWLSPTRQVRPLWGHGPRKSREPVCVGWRSFQGRRHPAEFRRIHTRWPVERELGLFFLPEAFTFSDHVVRGSPLLSHEAGKGGEAVLASAPACTRTAPSTPPANR